MPDRDDRVIATTKSGTPITEDRAEKLAREAEEGYDLTTWKRVGRRSLAGGAGHSPRMNFRVTSDLYEQAAELAERDDKSISQVARDALEQYVIRDRETKSGTFDRDDTIERPDVKRRPVTRSPRGR